MPPTSAAAPGSASCSGTSPAAKHGQAGGSESGGPLDDGRNSRPPTIHPTTAPTPIRATNANAPKPMRELYSGLYHEQADGTAYHRPHRAGESDRPVGRIHFHTITFHNTCQPPNARDHPVAASKVTIRKRSIRDLGASICSRIDVSRLHSCDSTFPYCNRPRLHQIVIKSSGSAHGPN